jgi:serine phosphatase RsbU (regulator of sigma subunit)
MTIRPSIFITSSEQTSDSLESVMNDLMCNWPEGLPPTFTTKGVQADAALFIANEYTELLSLLPTLLELQSQNVPTIVCCDDFGDLHDIITKLGICKLANDANAYTISGVLFGLLSRNEQVSTLRSKMGLVQTMHEGLQEDVSELQGELETAATVQQEFMSTDINDVHGISFSSIWRPANVVSGDMYDITQLDDDHVALFIADAIGHGITAAMLAMMLTRTLAANRFDSKTGQFSEPSEVLRSLNAALLQRTGIAARFATAAYTIINCKTNTMTYAGAGHPPALLRRIGQSPILLESEGPLLGIFEQDAFPQHTLKFSTGDTLLMYSDGFEDVLGEKTGSNQNLPSHLQALHTFCDNTNEDVLKDINAFLNQAKDNFADDLTMISMRATPVAPEIGLAA